MIEHKSFCAYIFYHYSNYNLQCFSFKNDLTILDKYKLIIQCVAVR
jgi:hypothetical protein